LIDAVAPACKLIEADVIDQLEGGASLNKPEDR